MGRNPYFSLRKPLTSSQPSSSDHIGDCEAAGFAGCGAAVSVCAGAGEAANTTPHRNASATHRNRGRSSARAAAFEPALHPAHPAEPVLEVTGLVTHPLLCDRVGEDQEALRADGVDDHVRDLFGL